MSRLAIEFRDVPDGIDWDDSHPQCSRRQLTATDILSSIDDAKSLKKRALVYLQHFLVDEFPSLSMLQQVLPSAHADNTVMKTTVVPMKILLKMRNLHLKMQRYYML